MSDTFKRYVQVGRVVLLNEGPSKGKLAVIVEIIDHNRALIDGPSSGVARQPFAYRRLSLTPFTVKLTRGASEAQVKKVWAAAAVEEKWTKSAWATKIAAREKRRALGDFDRFVVGELKREKRNATRKAVKA